MNRYQTSTALSAEEREQLILEHLPQVRLIARRIHERLPESVNLEDLVSTGIVGLISAIDRYDPLLNVKLKTYAEYKIRGAILDSLRGLDWAPRQQRRRSKQIESCIASLEQRLHRVPTEEEIAAELGLGLEEYHEWLVELRGITSAAWSIRRGRRRAETCSVSSQTTKKSGLRGSTRNRSCFACWARRLAGCHRLSAPFSASTTRTS